MIMSKSKMQKQEKQKVKAHLKTPISYYGGKQSMLKHILPLIPEHTTYVEPFFGGGAVFFAKEVSKVEIINDYNANVVNFYRQLKLNFEVLKDKIDTTLYSRETYKQALVIYETPHLFNELQRAWAFWVCTVQGFSNKIGSWRGSNTRHKESLLNYNKRLNFTEDLSKRLDVTQIECRNAISVILRADSPETFFYIDPPYVDSNQGHYGGYMQEHFDELLEVLSKLKGKFLLSSYLNDSLLKYRKECGWFSSDKDMHLSASSTSNSRKIEALTANYQI